MASFETAQLINELYEDTKKVIATAEQHFAPLGAEQLQWKPSAKQWSIIECMEHMNIALEHYLAEITKGIEKGRQLRWSPHTHFKSGRMGNYFAKMIKPTSKGEITNKMKTFKKFSQFTTANESPEKVMARFFDYQQQVLNLLEQSKEVDLEKVRIKSAIGGWLMFKLGDAFRFVIGHHQRHIIQAQNVLALMNNSEEMKR